MIKFAFIGGTMCGYRLLETLLKNDHLPLFAITLKEDEHEVEKYSHEISELLIRKNISNATKRKLTVSDYQLITDSDLDFIIVSGWRTLINPEVSGHTRYGIIASHFSLLPKYRGFAPVQWAVINGENETGVTLFRIGEGEVDSGKIISQKKVPILPDETGWELNQKITEMSNELYLEFIENLKTKTVKYREQNESEATYTCKRIPEDGRIKWERSSSEIHNLIRAIAHPYPGAFCLFNEQTFHIRKATPGDYDRKNYSGRIPGRIININTGGIEVLCGSGTIRITEWENKNDNLISNPNEDVKSIKATLR